MTFRDDSSYRSPDPSKHADVAATKDQIALAVAQAQSCPTKGDPVEWSCTYKDGQWSKWATLNSPSRSEINAGGQINLHCHARASDMRTHNARFYPGPGDPAAVFKTGDPMFIITPDRNTIIQVGIRSGKYFCESVWQRPNTVARIKDYKNWKPVQ